MKKILLAALVAFGMTACDSSESTDGAQNHAEKANTNQEATAEAAGNAPGDDDTGNFGAAVSADGAIAGNELLERLDGMDSLRIKVRGGISACCQAKGCWMTMPLAEGQDMMVKFKDYGFFVPKNAAGKEAVVEGWAYRELVSVEELQHYAADEGLPQEEIDAITEPEERITFMADGVLIEASAQAAEE